MIITYTPEGEKPQRFEWDAGDVRAREAELIEAKADTTWDQFQFELLQGKMRARRVLLWHLLRREHPALKLDDVDFASKEVEVDFNADEWAKIRTGVEKMSGVTDEQRTAALTMIDTAMDKAGEPEGKALSESSAKSTP